MLQPLPATVKSAIDYSDLPAVWVVFGVGVGGSVLVPNVAGGGAVLSALEGELRLLLYLAVVLLLLDDCVYLRVDGVCP